MIDVFLSFKIKIKKKSGMQVDLEVDSPSSLADSQSFILLNE